ncbi:maestro heat-like repeat-containing protein family member 1 isoform X7 [Mauremys reevesii]|uniref:maestro heat-like repeat-containing protein family member 1 isoform X7 n=1 Tax=Mauremys reevesii TaxID=260615 RepID=UPI00193F8838|nr:maestro heat-like repeat-containing protein family member 1 isoform X7 [Mauremys reevesii]
MGHFSFGADMDLYGYLRRLLVQSGATDQGNEATEATGFCSPSLSEPAASDTAVQETSVSARDGNPPDTESSGPGVNMGLLDRLYQRLTQTIGWTPFQTDRTNLDSSQPGPTDSSVPDTEEQKVAQKQDLTPQTLAAGAGSHSSTFCAEPHDPGTKRKAYSSPRGQLTPISKEEEEERPRKTRGLACVRDMDEAALRKDIGILFPALHSMVCHLPREHLEERREALDSLIHLARLFLVELLVFLFRRLNRDEEEETCASLLILDQIVRSNISEMTQHTEQLFIALGPILQCTSIRVREALAYLIRTMGAHGLLEKSTSRPLIDFLVHQCTLPLDSTEAADGRHTMELEVRHLCSSTLQSLGDSPRMANVLWPGLLLQLSPAAHGPALPLLLQTSVGVVKRLQEEGRLPLAGKCGKANRGCRSSPRASLPQELLARLLVLGASSCMTVQVRRAAMFLLFQLMSMFQAGSGQYWNNYTTEMLLYVEDHKTCFCQREWEQQLLQFLEDLLFLISDHTWLGCFITSIRRQLAHSDKRPSDKSFLYKCWGTGLMLSPAESIKPQLWRLLELVNFREEEEREGFARALGLCARQHLYEIFAILEHWEEVVSRVQLQPSAAGSLEEPASIEQLRSLLLLTYGHVVHSGPTDLILETIGYNILSPMRKHYFLSPHDPLVRSAFVRSLVLVGEAVTQVSRIPLVSQDTYTVLSPLLEILRGKDRTRLQSPDHKCALLAISYIGKFQPHLSKEQVAETISTCVTSYMVQRPALVKLRGTEVAESSAIRAESLQELPWEGLDHVLQTFLEQHLTPTTLLQLFLHLQPWICSPRAQERSRAVKASARLLMFYRFKAMTEDLKPMVEQGYMAGLLTSQAFDAQKTTRYWAYQALYWLFTPCTAVVYSKTGALLTVLSKTQQDASCRESPAHVAMLIAEHLQSRDLMPFSFTLLVGLLEKGECAEQLAGVMEAVLRQQKSELQGQVQDLQAALSYTLSPPRGERLSDGTRDILHLLARQHTKTAVNILLKMPWPYKHHIKAIWRFLGADPMLTREVLHILLDDSPEKGWANPGQTQDRSCPQPARLPPTTIYGLWELIGALGQGDTLEGCEDDLFASCFLAIACPPAQHLLGVQQDRPSDTSPRSLQASQEGERMACTALFAEFLGSPLLMENEPKAMRKQVLKAMLQQTQDSNIHIRGRALHGLRNAVTAFPDKVRKKQDQILASFVHGVCQSCDPCAILDATEGLCWMLRDPKAPLKAHVAIPLAMQARTFFEDENSSLRRASIELFGQLSKFVSKRSSRFGAEVEKSMGTLLIRLQDGDPQVAQACRVALLHCAPFLSYQPLRTLVRSQLAEGAAPAIPTFLSEACRTLLQDCPGRLSKKAALRAAAAQQLIDSLPPNWEKSPCVSKTGELTVRNIKFLEAEREKFESTPWGTYSDYQTMAGLTASSTMSLIQHARDIIACKGKPGGLRAAVLLDLDTEF